MHTLNLRTSVTWNILRPLEMANISQHDVKTGSKILYLTCQFGGLVTFKWNIRNKTADYHRHILRLPIFVKKGIKKDENDFFLEKTLFLHQSF